MGKINKIITLYFFILLLISGCAKQKDPVLEELYYVMNNRDKYIDIKENKIDNIKQNLLTENLTPYQTYELNQQLYYEYLKYQLDSAIEYIQKNREIAFKLNDLELLNESAIYLSSLYSSVGLYTEGGELLQGIDRESLSSRLLTVYYDAFAEFYSHYGQSNNKGMFYALSGLYRDSVLYTLDTLSFRYRLEFTTRQMFSHYDLEQEQSLLNLLEEAGESPQKAQVAWMLGYMYHREIFENQRKEYAKISTKYYSMAVISDVKNCVRDNASMQSLAVIFFDHGEIGLANTFIYAAFEDAMACNVRYRIMDASTYYPIINAIYQEQEKRQMRRISISLIIISLLLIILMLSLCFVFRQNKRLSRMSQALSKANIELEDLHNVKDKLFSVIAHDLRGPMSALMSLLKLPDEKELDVKIYHSLFRDISKRVGDTFGLLDNLLRWTKTQMRGIVPSPAYFDVQYETKSVIEGLHHTIASKNLTIFNKIEKQQVYADSDMFAVVLRNLITNAIKYSNAGCEIKVFSELIDNMLVISVKDSGTGMTPEVQKKLFKISETKSQRGTNNESGTGLGLILCADFVKLNGGKIWFTSKENEGSTFSFSIPIER